MQELGIGNLYHSGCGNFQHGDAKSNKVPRDLALGWSNENRQLTWNCDMKLKERTIYWARKK